MTRTWEQEKAYTARRAQQLAAQMEQAIADNDKSAFLNAYATSMRYMPRKQRGTYYRRFLAQNV